MTLTLIVVALLTSTVGWLQWGAGRVRRKTALGSVSQQWLAE